MDKRRLLDLLLTAYSHWFTATEYCENNDCVEQELTLAAIWFNRAALEAGKDSREVVEAMEWWYKECWKEKEKRGEEEECIIETERRIQDWMGRVLELW